MGLLYVPVGSEAFTWQKSNVEGVRPNPTTWGTSITPGNNSKGAYSVVLSGSDVAFDAYAMRICLHNNFVTFAARSTIVDIGVDPAGGTAYQVIVPDLLASSASGLSDGQGINYYFPIFVKAGSQIAARASIASGAVGTLRCVISLFGKPRRRELVWCGEKVIAYGITAASSSGTVLIPGTVAEGAWTLIAANIAESPRFWQMGMGIFDTTMTNRNQYFLDSGFGASPNQTILTRDQSFTIPSAVEAFSSPGRFRGCGRYVGAGNSLWIRGQCSGTPDANLSAALYGVI